MEFYYPSANKLAFIDNSLPQDQQPPENNPHRGRICNGSPSFHSGVGLNFPEETKLTNSRALCPVPMSCAPSTSAGKLPKGVASSPHSPDGLPRATGKAVFQNTSTRSCCVFRGVPLALHSGGFTRECLVPVSVGPYILLPLCISRLETPFSPTQVREAQSAAREACPRSIPATLFTDIILFGH